MDTVLAARHAPTGIVCIAKCATNQTFSDSSAACQADGGTLAMPRDAGINTFLITLINMHRPDKVWFGLHDQRNEGQWTWVDRSALGTYSTWAPGEPNNLQDQDCASYWRWSSDYLWDDKDCDAFLLPFICQVLLSALSQPTTEIPTTPRLETSPTSTTVRTTQATSTQSQVSSTPRQEQLPGTTVAQHITTNQTTQSYQTAHRTTLPGTTVSQSPTNQTTKLAGGAWNKTKPRDIALVCAGCAVGLVGMCGVLLYCVKRRQRRRQVAQHPQEITE
ncbi:hypothetical protein Bbelb_079550 [Branchiostoma belcheri]|nr:hypothetical protein Bbelb_079550 [Branchiostoma belcheri]